MSEIGTSRHRGFTLIELLVVMSVFASVVAIGVFAIESLEARRAEREIVRLVEWLKSVRREALVSGRRYEIAAKAEGLVTRPAFAEFKPRYFKEVLISSRGLDRRWGRPCFFPDGSGCPAVLYLGEKRDLGIRIGWLGDIEGPQLP